MSQVSIRQFVEAHFRPACEQLEGAGASHVVVVCIPGANVFRVYSGLPPGARADQLERMADDLRAAASKLRAQSSAPSILIPNAGKLA